MLNSMWIAVRDATEDVNNDHGGGAGSALNPAVLISAGVATFVATVVSVIGIVFQLKVSLPRHWMISNTGGSWYPAHRTTGNRYYNGALHVRTSVSHPFQPYSVRMTVRIMVMVPLLVFKLMWFRVGTYHHYQNQIRYFLFDIIILFECCICH